MTAYEISYNGNVELQCQNGTYPLCREDYLHSLQNAVEHGEMSALDAENKVKSADALWDKYKGTPKAEEQALLTSQEQMEKVEAVLRSASAELTEIRGVETTVGIVEDVLPDPEPSAPDTPEIPAVVETTPVSVPEKKKKKSFFTK